MSYLTEKAENVLNGFGFNKQSDGITFSKEGHDLRFRLMPGMLIMHSYVATFRNISLYNVKTKEQLRLKVEGVLKKEGRTQRASLRKSKVVAKTNTQRQKASDDRHREAGHVGRKVWATPDEHVWLKEQLDNKRKTS